MWSLIIDCLMYKIPIKESYKMRIERKGQKPYIFFMNMMKNGELESQRFIK